MKQDAQISSDDARLRAALKGIDRPLLMERSVKAVTNGLITGRYLVSFPRAALGPGPSRKLRGILENLEAPPDEIAALDSVQASSQSVHFGFEPDPKGTWYKCYLEFSLRDRPHPDLTFIALKWAADGRCATTLYHDRDALNHDQQSQLVLDILPDSSVRDTFLALMAASSGSGSLRFLEVTEPGNPRRSVDLNLADKGVKVADYHSALLDLLGRDPAAEAYLQHCKADSLGHVAAGTNREGKAFGTLYHGAHRVSGDL